MMALIGIVLAGIALLMVIGVVMAVLGAALAAFFKVLPLLVIGWVAVKLIQRHERRR
ncbi:MAG: hypothetical protein ICV87_07935, partial [Gemmatimonadetes bacterium]|nr:hypothetical protein [Gemmatimonadota bacterium]